jgi:hypothetical protein
MEKVDPQGEIDYCTKISDQAISLGIAVIEAILSQLPKIKWKEHIIYR